MSPMKSTAEALIHVEFENKNAAFKFSNLGHFPTVFVSFKSDLSGNAV